ncbi:ATP-binding cassette domain-containing protein [Acidothermaceae bacterium B102]|nr:ATP-binding cassette domain-containing protein [Acidothermaceae bacterium B102]
MTDASLPLVDLQSMSIFTPRRVCLVTDLTWVVRPGERWALLGPNGAGKSTTLSVVGATRHPSAGVAEVLGRRLGRTDLRELRTHIGVVDHALRIPPDLSAVEVVLTGLSGTVQTLIEGYSADDHARALELLTLLGCAALVDRGVQTWSHGEKARVRIARAMIGRPPLLLLDEPASGLDLPGREDLMEAIDGVVAANPLLGLVLVTHHLEELPTSIDHALLLRDSHAVAQGPVDEVLTDEHVSSCFGRPISVRRTAGRWTATA